MSLNKIDAELTQENEDLAIQHVRDGRSLLPFLVGLPTKEIRRMAKLGDSYVEFVNRKAGELAWPQISKSEISCSKQQFSCPDKTFLVPGTNFLSRQDVSCFKQQISFKYKTFLVHRRIFLF